MKQLLIGVLIFLASKVSACDGCTMSTGIINNDPVNYLSFKYKNTNVSGVESSFFRHSGAGGFLDEVYTDFDFAFKYFVYKSFYTQAIFKYQTVNIRREDEKESVQGFSDPIWLVGYQAVKNIKKWQFNYNVYAGFDIMIGKYSTISDVEYSPGSRSSDAIVGFDFSFKRNALGLLFKNNWKYNFNNSRNYQFGQVINNGFAATYTFEKENYSLIPYAGVDFELDASDRDKIGVVNSSRSSVLFAIAGMNFLFSEKVLIGGKYQLALFKDVSGWESIDISGFQIELTYIFK